MLTTQASKTSWRYFCFINRKQRLFMRQIQTLCVCISFRKHQHELAVIKKETRIVFLKKPYLRLSTLPWPFCRFLLFECWGNKSVKQNLIKRTAPSAGLEGNCYRVSAMIKCVVRPLTVFDFNNHFFKSQFIAANKETCNFIDFF